jgi:xanthine dehydrogenase accessory factor
MLDQVLSARAERQPVALITALDDGAQRLVQARDCAEDNLAEVLQVAFRSDKSGVHSTPSGEVFIQVFNPALRLVIIGAVHIAQALAPMAAAAGYEVTVVDPRAAFAKPARFAGICVRADWPDEVLPELGLDGRTAFAALTHDPKIDDPALNMALQSGCFYIGALGSRMTQAARRERLAAAGHEDAALARIRGPIGLDIGARGSAEIAISIMAEITQTLRMAE